jgi:hypothetical protein
MEVVAITAAAMMAFSQVRGGYAEKEAHNYQAQVAENQAVGERGMARMSEIEADQERLKGSIAVQEHEKKSRALLGEFAAKTAARGVAMTGSPLEFLATTAEDLAFERQTIKYGSDVEAWKKRTQGTIHLNRAKLLDSEASAMRQIGKDAVVSGWLKGMGTLGLAGYNIYGKPPIDAGAAAGTGGGMDTSWGVGGDHRF